MCPSRGGRTSRPRSSCDQLEGQIDQINRRLRAEHADHPYVPLLSVPGIRWVLAFTIVAEIGDIARFASPRKFTGYTGLCPRVVQGIVGGDDARASPSRLLGALPAHEEAVRQAARAKVAQVDVARRLAHAIWHMLTRGEEFAPRGAAFRLAA
jgi:transposase